MAAAARAKLGDWNLVGLFHRSAVAQVACGVFHTMFLLQSSEVFAVGRGDWGLLGMGDRMDRKLPCKITELQVPAALNSQPRTPDPLITQLQDQRVAFIACGLRHRLSQHQTSAPLPLTLASSAAISFDGHLYTWGCGSNGRLGLGDAVDSSVPQ